MCLWIKTAVGLGVCIYLWNVFRLDGRLHKFGVIRRVKSNNPRPPCNSVHMNELSLNAATAWPGLSSLGLTEWCLQVLQNNNKIISGHLNLLIWIQSIRWTDTWTRALTRVGGGWGKSHNALPSHQQPLRTLSSYMIIKRRQDGLGLHWRHQGHVFSFILNNLRRNWIYILQMHINLHKADCDLIHVWWSLFSPILRPNEKEISIK